MFGCIPVPPERNLSGPQLEAGTGVPGSTIAGMHLRLPGAGADGPTLEIFSYSRLADGPCACRQSPGFAHIAFAVASVSEARAEVLAAGGSRYGRGGDDDDGERRASDLVLRHRIPSATWSTVREAWICDGETYMSLKRRERIGVLFKIGPHIKELDGMRAGRLCSRHFDCGRARGGGVAVAGARPGHAAGRGARGYRQGRDRGIETTGAPSASIAVVPEQTDRLRSCLRARAARTADGGPAEYATASDRSASSSRRAAILLLAEEGKLSLDDSRRPLAA